MKKRLLICGLVLGLSGRCWAGFYTFTDTANQGIPDGGAALTTLSRSITVSGVSGNVLSSISVTLNVSGGFNGDLYGYLRGPNGGIAILLNRVGQSGSNPGGYGDTGFAITLSDLASHDVHAYQDYSPSYTSGQLTGSWQSDGRNTDPATVSFGDSRTAGLNSFLGSDPNGTWTLVFSDWVTSGDPSTLASWSLNLTVIPEPTNIALEVLAVLAGGYRLIAWRRKAARS